MATKLFTFLLVSALLEISFAALMAEHHPVTDASLQEKGYVCHKKGVLEPMKLYEKNPNFSKEVCQEVICLERGLLAYATCSLRAINGVMVKGKEDPTKPFPECCGPAE